MEAKNHFQPVQFTAHMVLLIIVGFPLLFVLEITSFLWNPITMVLYGLLFVFSVMWAGGANLNQLRDVDTPNQKELVISLTIMSVITAVVGYSQLCRYLHLNYGLFEATSNGYWYWLRFGLANFLEATFLDIPQIYQLGITDVQANTFWPQTLLFVFRLSLSYIIVKQIYDAFQFVMAKPDNPRLKVGLSEFTAEHAAFLILSIPWVALLFGSVVLILNNGVLKGFWATSLAILPWLEGIWIIVFIVHGFFSLGKNTHKIMIVIFCVVFGMMIF